MKHINFILILGILIVFVSCSTSTTFIVHTNPGTEILTSGRQHLAFADNNGKATIKLDNDSYYAFLLSHSPNSEDFIPFALDYRHRNNAGTGTLLGLGYSIAAAGLTAMLTGTLAIAGGDEDLGSNFFLIGVAGTGLGMTLGWPADIVLDQTAQQNEYKYLPDQTTNQNIQITKPKFDK